ncbi:MFS transporter [Nocardia sp. PE-7]|uniref:MFS transporter n=1 Tax=Nocardia sp. PE-7 TaxID=3058426 RepID=UPI002659256A|nr:MFS transporter [Nocardia sp. PE-7]WKG10839.1 MFS transporter [Nocardia sp. PE-7]
MSSSGPSRAVAAGSGVVLLVLASGQFLMTLDTSVMNVSMAQVAEDLDTTITGIQTAMTLYTLVMATLMITGGKVGTIIGRRRAFAIGLVIYGAGSLTTSLAPSLPVLLLGWSLLEGIGAALIMPAIVALVAGNFPPERRSAAYGLVAAAGAMAVAAGPLIGGAVTTFASWRYVFAGESVLVVIILFALRRINDVAPAKVRIDLIGSVLSVLSLGMIVYGVLRSSEWGWVQPKPGGADIAGLSPVVWLLLGGMLLLYVFARWQNHLADTGGEPLVDPALFRNRQLTGGLTMFLGQYTVQAGVFFTVPLFLTIVLELDALQTGIRLVPLSVALLLSAVGIPKIWPRANPRRVVRAGMAAMIVGILFLVAGMDPGADASVVAIPMLLMGVGLGALASQLGAVTVSAVPNEQSAEVGGLQNTASNLGASLGTALVGSVLIATLSTSVIAGINDDPDVPTSVKQQATIELAAGVPFLSDTQLREALQGNAVPEPQATEILEVNEQARLDALRVAFSLTALLAIAALFGTGRIPRHPQVGSAPTSSQPRAPGG